MATTVKHRVEGLKVVNDHGVQDEFRKVTPIVTETYMDGTQTTYNKLATITTRTGEHVNHLGDGLFETLSGVRWRLVS